MSNHSVAEAKNRLSDLIDRALEGEAIVITRHGRAVVEIKPVVQVSRPVTPIDIDWLAERRIARARGRTNAGKLVSAMRDEDDR